VDAAVLVVLALGIGHHRGDHFRAVPAVAATMRDSGRGAAECVRRAFVRLVPFLAGPCRQAAEVAIRVFAVAAGLRVEGSALGGAIDR